ncbi:hypothetical protein ASG17_07285 [Brevundimonas sp. Leaf363]|uniref:FkbM family methyltransferase n=1 Tax=Brevundimonas sp. Leaf363 TaxID=1736353 RepID=UPI0006FDCF89|nr:FkbM family methyltransferase [Brevundimonas sp. Leaf363]KQS55851.1 hypothetical protein ASG17_07285 [Brevundimonas sp. Leaf363]
MAEPVTFFGCQLEAGWGGRSDKADLLAIFEHLKPKASARPIIRIGGDGDGAYLIPDDLEGIVACFSPGVANTKSFEDTMVDDYGIRCHMCDLSSDVERFRTPLKVGSQTFEKKWLDLAIDENSVTLEDWIRRHEPHGDLLLQMDIEGAEYRNVIAADDSVLSRFRIIIIELHGLGRMLRDGAMRAIYKPFFEKLDKNFTSVHVHPNNNGGIFSIPETDVEIPHTLEITYVRKDRIDVGRFEPMLPHPLDVNFNVRRCPPLFLSDNWLSGDRPPASRMKMLEAELSYKDWLLEDRENVSRETGAMMLRAIETAGRLDTQMSRHEDIEIAHGRPYFGKTGSVSGILAPDPRYFFHSRDAVGEYIGIDLGAENPVNRVRITNRLDGYFGRAKSLFVVISNTRSPEDGHVVAIPDIDDFTQGRLKSLDVDTGGLRGRYVFVKSTERTILHLANVEVFARVKAGPAA